MFVVVVAADAVIVCLVYLQLVGGGSGGVVVVRFCRIFTDLVRYNNAIDATAVNKQTKRQTNEWTDGL